MDIETVGECTGLANKALADCVDIPAEVMGTEGTENKAIRHLMHGIGALEKSKTVQISAACVDIPVNHLQVKRVAATAVSLIAPVGYFFAIIPLPKFTMDKGAVVATVNQTFFLE